jgi:hypothetical protein
LYNSDYAVAFQTIALDGTNFVVGDEIFLSDLAQLISSQSPLDGIYMEIAFRNGGTDDVVRAVGDIDFANSVFTEVIFSTTGNELFSNPTIVIPDFITSLNGTTTGIGIALSIGSIDTNNAFTDSSVCKLFSRINQVYRAQRKLMFRGSTVPSL